MKQWLQLKINYLLQFRIAFSCCLAFCIILLTGSYFIEFYLHVHPCPLCTLQRLLYIVLGFTFILGIIHNPKKFSQYVYCLFALLCTISGIVLATRQIWLQHLTPEHMPACIPGLQRLLAAHPFLDVLKIIFDGASECLDTHLIIFGLSLAHWSLLSFIALTVVFLLMIFKLFNKT